MKQFSKLMLIALSFGIVTLALSLVPSKPVGAAGSAPVMVTNTPLPVQGTVGAAQSGPWSVGVTGSVNATQSGPWSRHGWRSPKWPVECWRNWQRKCHAERALERGN